MKEPGEKELIESVLEVSTEANQKSFSDYKEASVMGEALRELMKDELEESYASGLAEGHASGLAEGRASGLAEGRASGLAEGRESGVAEGRQAGTEDQRKKSVIRMLDLGRKPKEISDFTGEDYSYIQNTAREWQLQIRQNSPFQTGEEK